MGCGLRGAAVQPRLHHGSLSIDEESTDAAVECADSRSLHAAVRARSPFLRSGAAVGAYPHARAPGQPAYLESEQLQPADDRSVRQQGSQADSAGRSACGAAPAGGVAMLTLKRASALGRELSAARHIPCSAHVSEHVVK